jgi:hypothetical protein
MNSSMKYHRYLTVVLWNIPCIPGIVSSQIRNSIALHAIPDTQLTWSKKWSQKHHQRCEKPRVLPRFFGYKLNPAILCLHNQYKDDDSMGKS